MIERNVTSQRPVLTTRTEKPAAPLYRRPRLAHIGSIVRTVQSGPTGNRTSAARSTRTRPSAGAGNRATTVTTAAHAKPPGTAPIEDEAVYEFLDEFLGDLQHGRPLRMDAELDRLEAEFRRLQGEINEGHVVAMAVAGGEEHHDPEREREGHCQRDGAKPPQRFHRPAPQSKSFQN